MVADRTPDWSPQDETGAAGPERGQGEGEGGRGGGAGREARGAGPGAPPSASTTPTKPPKGPASLMSPGICGCRRATRTRPFGSRTRPCWGSTTSSWTPWARRARRSADSAVRERRRDLFELRAAHLREKRLKRDESDVVTLADRPHWCRSVISVT